MLFCDKCWMLQDWCFVAGVLLQVLDAVLWQVLDAVL